MYTYNKCYITPADVDIKHVKYSIICNNVPQGIFHLVETGYYVSNASLNWKNNVRE